MQGVPSRNLIQFYPFDIYSNIQLASTTFSLLDGHASLITLTYLLGGPYEIEDFFHDLSLCTDHCGSRTEYSES